MIMSDSSGPSNNNNTTSDEGLQLSSDTLALNNKNKAVTVPDGMKMSFRSLSNEITIFEIKTPGPNPAESIKGNFRSSFNQFEFSNDLECNILEQGEDDDDGETRMDAALMLETELVEDDPIEEEVVIETTPIVINQTTVTVPTTTTSPSPPPAAITVTPKYHHHLHNVNNCVQLGSHGSRGRSPMKIIPVTTNPVKNTSVSLSSSSSSVPDAETTTIDSNDIKIVSMGGNSTGTTNKGIKIPRRRKRKRVFTPSRLANTSIYRTRTVVKAATLAAQNQLATETAEKHNKTLLLSPQNPQQSSFLSRAPASPKAKTMKEVLASIPGFSAGRPRKRHYRKLSTAAQLEQTKKDGSIDLETPGSILTQVNLKSILNKHTFYLLPPLYQFKLLQLLPEVDGVQGPDPTIKLSNSALSNEFFTKSCQEWTEKLSAGELTVDQRQRNRQEAERERLKLDPWKVKHFEPIWGMKGTPSSSALKIQSKSQAPATITKPARTLTPPPPLHGHSLRHSSARQILRLSPRFDFGSEKTVSRSSPPILSKALAATVRRKPELIEDDDEDDDEDDVDDEDYAVSEEEEDDSDVDEPTIAPSVSRRLEHKNILSSSKHPIVLSTTNSSSPSNKRPANRNDKPPGLIKKIKIIPPMPPSGKQVAFNMEVKVEEIQPATPVLTPSTDPDGDVEGDLTELMDEDVDEQLATTSVEEKPEAEVVVPSPAVCNITEENVDSTPHEDSSSTSPAPPPSVPSTAASVSDKSLDDLNSSSETSLPLSKSQIPVLTASTESPVKSLSSSPKSFNSATCTTTTTHPILPLEVQPSQSLVSEAEESGCSAPGSVTVKSPPSIPSPTKDISHVQSSPKPSESPETNETKTILPIVVEPKSEPPSPSNVVEIKTEQDISKLSPPFTQSTILSTTEDETLSSTINSLLHLDDVTITVAPAPTPIIDSVSSEKETLLLPKPETTIVVVVAETSTLQVEPAGGQKQEKVSSQTMSQKVSTAANCPTSSSSICKIEEKTVTLNNPLPVKISSTLTSGIEPSKSTTTTHENTSSSNQRTTTTTSLVTTSSSATLQPNNRVTRSASPGSPTLVNVSIKPTGVQTVPAATKSKLANDPDTQTLKSVRGGTTKTSVVSKSEPLSPKTNKIVITSSGNNNNSGANSSSQSLPTTTPVPTKSTTTTSLVSGPSHKVKVGQSDNSSSPCSTTTTVSQNSVPKKTCHPPSTHVKTKEGGDQISLSGGGTTKTPVISSVKMKTETIVKTNSPPVNPTSDDTNNSTKNKCTNEHGKVTSVGDGSNGGKPTTQGDVKVQLTVKKENKDTGKSIVPGSQEIVVGNTSQPSCSSSPSKATATVPNVSDDPKASASTEDFDDDCIIVTIEQKEPSGVVTHVTKMPAQSKVITSEVSGLENKTSQQRKEETHSTQQQQQKREILRGKQIVKETASLGQDKKKIVGQQKKEGLAVIQPNIQQQQLKENQKRQQQQQSLPGHELSTMSTTKMATLSPAQVAIAKATNQLAKNPDVTLKPLLIKPAGQIPTPTKIGTQIQNIKTLQLQIRPATTTSLSIVDQMKIQTPILTLETPITTSSSLGSPIMTVGSPGGGGNQLPGQQQQQSTTVRSQPVYVKMIPVGVPLDNSTTTQQQEVGKFATLFSATGATLTKTNSVPIEGGVTTTSTPIPITISTSAVTTMAAVVVSSSSSIGGSKASTATVSLTPVVSAGSSSTSVVAVSVAGTGGSTVISDKLAKTPSSINVVVSNQSQSNLQNTQQSKQVNAHQQYASTLPYPNPALVGSSQANSKTQTHHKSRPQKAKQIPKMPRTSSVPPGSINLERSYQICQAVIQNSPNREQLQNQLVKPPTPAPPLKIDAAKILQHQQFNQQQSLQGHQIVTNDSTLIQVQRRSTTPTILQTPLQATSVPMMQPHQKVIVIPAGGGNGPVTITQHHLHPQTSQQQQQQHGGTTTTVVPLIRPVQPGSPIVLHHGGPRAQLVVSSETPSSSVGNSALTNTVANNLCSNVTSNTVPVNLMHMGVGVGHGMGNNSNNHNHGPSPTSKFPQIHQPTLQMPIQMQAASSSHSANNLNSSINNNLNNHVQTQSTPPTATATIITPQQLAMLIQQQQANCQQQSPQQQANCQQRSQTMVNPLSLPLSSVQNSVTLPFSTQTITTRPLTHPNRPNSASSVQSLLSQMSNNSSNNSPNSVFIQSGTNPSSSQAITVSSNSVTGTTSAIKIISSNSFFHQPNVRSMPHTIHIPISQASQIQIQQQRQQQQQQQASGTVLRHTIPQTNNTFSINSGNNSGGFPVRAQIVTSNGETLTIHRASSIPINSLSGLTNGPIRLRNINMAQVKRTPGGSFVISSGNSHHQDGNNVRLSPSQQQQTFVTGNDHSQLISTGQLQNQLSVVNSIAVSAPTSNTITMTRTGIMSVSQNSNNKNQQTSQIMRCPVRIISHPSSQGNLESQNFTNNVNTNLNLSNENSTSQQSQSSSTTIINSVSNLADFITNQLAASNIRPISPLAFENGQRGNSVTTSSEGERNSPNVFSTQSSQPQQQQQQNFISTEIQDISNSQNQQVDDQRSSPSVVLVSVLNPGSNSMTTDGNTLTSSNGGTIVRKGIQNIDKLSSQNPMVDLMSCSNEAVLDLQDAISVNVDSPYSLISEPDPPNIAEIIDVPTTIENIENISAVSSSNSTVANSNLGTSSSFFQNNGNCSITSPIWLNGSEQSNNQSPGLIHIQDNSSSSPLPPPQSAIVHNVSVTNNNNKRRLDAPVVVSEVDRNTLLVQSQSQQNQPLHQQANLVQRIESPNPLAGRASTEGVRQQQYIIVQTTGSNGLPTNLAVPASIMISNQVLMDQQTNKGPPRASSAPLPGASPIQNHTVILNAHEQGTTGTIPISFAGAQSGNIMTMTPVSMPQNITTTVNMTGQQLGDNSGIKNVQLPLDIQDSSIRVLYSGQNGSSSIQQMTLGQFQQQQRQQKQQTHPCIISQNRGSPIQYTQIPTQTLQQQIVTAASQNVNVLQSQSSSAYPVTNQNHSGIVEVQVSQAPATIVQQQQQQAVNQVINIGTGNLSSNNSPNVVNLNLNSQSSSSTVSRIITTTQQPGQHPVISIPDTTQNCGGGVDIFSAIAESVKMEGLVSRTNNDCNGNGSMTVVNAESLGINVNLASINDSVTGSNNNNRRTNTDFQGVVEEVGPLILDSGGNCVCDLRAMIMCRKCGAYCHPDCYPDCHTEHHPPHKRNCLKETV